MKENLNMKEKTKRKMKKPVSNQKFVADLIAFAKVGPMMEIFVIDALSKGADRVVANEAAVLDAMKNSFVNGPAWVAAAKELKAAIAARG